MKKTSALMAVVFLFVFLVGCGVNNGNDNNNNSNNSDNKNNSNSSNNNTGDEEPKPEPELLKVGDYYPIKENIRYVYEGMGNEYASYDVYNDYILGDKVQQRVNNGGTVMARVIELKDGKLTKVYSRGEAYYRENLLATKSDDEEILLMEPLTEGTTWTLKDSRVRTITNTSVQLTTPTGSYQALEISTESANDKTVDYYAKDIGLVKSVFISGESEVTSTLSKIEENVPFVQQVNFYYPNIDDGKYYYLAKDIRFHTNDVTRKLLETAYKESVNGNVGKVLSTNANINSLYLNKDSNVYIDLNKDFITNMNAGAIYEDMILQSIAKTFGQYYNSEKVFLTIDNKLYESGHISMDKGEYLKVDYQDAIEIQ